MTNLTTIMDIERLWLRINKFRKRRFVKYGIPFFVLILGGSFYLEQFSQLKYQFGKHPTLLDPAQLRKQGIDVKDRKDVTLESEYEKIKNLDIDNWEQIRGPRPWEEPASSSEVA